jgi:outer membrane protein
MLFTLNRTPETRLEQVMPMKSRLSVVIAASLWSCVALAARGPDTLDLMQVYELALKIDPQIREADALRLASREAKPQAWAALLPQINATGGYTENESSSGSVGAVPVANPGPNDPLTRVQRRSSSFDGSSERFEVELRQTLFRWDQWVALRRASSQVAQAEADFIVASQDLIQRTAQRYFDVLAAKDTVDAADASLEAFTRQLEQADKRFEVGLIAITDVQEARAARDSAAASVIAAKRSLATAQELLRELTGEPIGSLAAPVANLSLKSPDDPQEDWVKLALQQNPRVISARLATDIVKQDISSARARRMPTVDLVVSDGSTSSDGDATNTGVPFPSSQDGDDEAISIQVSVPLFTGGRTSSQIRQSTYQHRAARERLERANRETERQTRDAYLGVQSEISRVQSLQQALKSSQTALEATEAGFEVGTRTTVDVLISRQNLAQARTAYLLSRYVYLTNVVNLKLAAGSLDEADLVEINQWLK